MIKFYIIIAIIILIAIFIFMPYIFKGKSSTISRERPYVQNEILNISLIILGGILWRMGGSDNFPNWLRRIGVATLFTLIALKNILGGFPFINWIAYIIIPATWIITWALLTIGYGETSPIGKLFSFISNQILKDIAIRGTCAICWSGAYLPAIYYRGNWFRILYCLVPIILMPIIRISKVDQLNPHIEEVLMGSVYLLGYILIWVF